MTAASVDQLHRRATKLTLSAAAVTIGKVHLARALSHAIAARADLSIIHDLRTSIDAINRVTRRAELQRLRLLRKADRQGATP